MQAITYSVLACVLAMMHGRAPATLTLARLRKLLRLCGFFLADALVLGLPAYLDGVVAQLKPPEVRCWRVATETRRLAKETRRLAKETRRVATETRRLDRLGAG